VVGNKPLVAPDDPSQVTDTGRSAGVKGERDSEPGRIAERLQPGGPELQSLGRQEALTDPLGLRQVETEQIASIQIVAHCQIE